MHCRSAKSERREGPNRRAFRRRYSSELHPRSRDFSCASILQSLSNLRKEDAENFEIARVEIWFYIKPANSVQLEEPVKNLGIYYTSYILPGWYKQKTDKQETVKTKITVMYPIMPHLSIEIYVWILHNNKTRNKNKEAWPSVNNNIVLAAQEALLDVEISLRVHLWQFLRPVYA